MERVSFVARRERKVEEGEEGRREEGEEERDRDLEEEGTEVEVGTERREGEEGGLGEGEEEEPSCTTFSAVSSLLLKYSREEIKAPYQNMKTLNTGRGK